ncbi:hypothetical protein FHS56_001244 [Thermonema lapsum]|uniref:DUF721 domain-containing protein n=1 Tax=Thermonema lapsum TaxID=28195 RepID=A0A846MQM5_9BACT|nr:DUF721 domain-containing protein [Thermonema lapsum]NIK73731.1 hypothetical protein [Thermonema lapsum]
MRDKHRIAHQKPLSFSEVLAHMIEQHQAKHRFYDMRIGDMWAQLLGPNVAEQTEKIYLRGDTLYVYLRSPVLKNQLLFARDKIKERLNAQMKREVIKKIVLC